MAELLSSKVVVLEVPPAVRSVPLVPTGIAAFLGLAAYGPIGTPTFISSWDEYVTIFGSYDANGDMTLAVENFFRNGGTACWCVRTVHYTDLTNPSTETSVQSFYDILDRGGAAAPAQVDSTAGPWHLDAGDHIDLDFDNGGTQVATVAATPAGQTSVGTAPFNLSGGETLTVKVNQGFTQTVTFQPGDFGTPGAATAAEVAQRINTDIVDAQAVVSGTAVAIYSDRLGTNSYIEITGGTANLILLFPTAEAQGTGNVADTRAVTPAEIAAMITLLPPSGSGTATVITGDKVRLESGATGLAAEVEVVATTVTKNPIYTVGVYNGSDAGTNSTLKIEGKYGGVRGDNISVEIKAATSGDSDEFNLEVSESGSLQETFPNLSMTDSDINYVEDVINDALTGSVLIEATDLDSPASSPNDLPAIGTYTLTGGDDGLSGLLDIDFIGNQAGPTGLYCFDDVQDIAIGPIVPNRCTSAVQNAQIDYAEITRGGSMFVPLGPPANNTAAQIVTYVSTTASLEGKSEFGAIYWPRIKILNPAPAIYGTANDITVDPVGMIAGIYARTDGALKGGIYRAPAGVEYGEIVGAVGFETNTVNKEGTRDLIASHRINPIRTNPGAPRYVDGHDTLLGNLNFPSVPERRGVIFIEQSLKRAMEAFRHSPNDSITRNGVEATITSFLIGQMNLRAFRSQDPAEAFSVDVSDAINPPQAEFDGKLYAKIALATNKPNKWIILEFSQDVRALQEAAA